MSFAEIILRVGVGIGGWLIFFGHALLLAAIPAADCDPTSDEMWRGTLLFGALAAVAVSSVGVGLLWRESLKVLATISLLLAVYALFRLAPAISTVVFGDAELVSICGARTALPEGVIAMRREATIVEQIWVPAQVLVLVLGVLQAIRFWMPRPATAPAATTIHE